VGARIGKREREPLSVSLSREDGKNWTGAYSWGRRFRKAIFGMESWSDKRKGRFGVSDLLIPGHLDKPPS